ncbi:vitamin B12 dependent-methionine synthase activation domain-containing protein [Clostridium sp. AM58-1XD]|uniref:vitamin B12 dependent-methionine synthase activation domain-containing protein n=1 Tax=Clostridium sp. AM58-1XD TaxID=2292307 RepID=UPI000E50A8D8|nr:vitamin B12 dependent-methionine synthase activation domain-containing protein [Clostridium sp. AM58-1XD]RGY96341.1 Vitamin B12 dependent methionine synthase activation subunit [Clostridium sp. AM58-1XD]
MRLEHVAKETRRYLGYGNREADEATDRLIAEAMEELLQTAVCRSVCREFDLFLPHGDEEGTVTTDAFTAKSRNLHKNLKDCEKVLIFGATLGAPVDKLIQRYERIRMSRAVVLQAAAAALIEEYCDEENSRWKTEYEEKGWYMRPRFSPGYGDFPLECQSGIIAALEAGKRIGITLTESLLMAPSKSVTAVIGLSRRKASCVLQGCEACAKTDCAYRRG